MKFNRGLLLSGVAVFIADVATAQDAAQDCVSVALSVIPPCAQPCFINGAPTIGCGGTDFKCQCEQQARMFAAIESCVQKSCPETEFQRTIDGSQKVCACASGASSGSSSNNAVVANKVQLSSFITGPTPAPTPTSVVQAPTGIPSGSPSTVPTAAANMASMERGIMVGAVGGALWAVLGL